MSIQNTYVIKIERIRNKIGRNDKKNIDKTELEPQKQTFISFDK